MFDYEKFRKNIKIYRENLGYTQEILAERANITWSYLSKIESGVQKPSTNAVVRLLNTFNLSFHDFMNINISTQEELLVNDILTILSGKCLEKDDEEFLISVYKAINKRGKHE